ncbi:MAG: hypothetical protein R3C28_06425 [Pirellulaceae bacterium]
MISITDGQIYLQPDLFFAGIRPAMNAGISVSEWVVRLKIKAMKKVAGGLRLDLAAFRELEAFAQLGTDLAPPRSRSWIEVTAWNCRKQPQFQPLNVIDQVLGIYAAREGFLIKFLFPMYNVGKRNSWNSVHLKHQDLWDELASKKGNGRRDRSESSVLIDSFNASFK